MIKAEIDITEAMVSFHIAAEHNDENQALAAIDIVSRKTLIEPVEVLSQIERSATNNDYVNDAKMAHELLDLLKDFQDQEQTKSQKIAGIIDDSEYCLDEIKKSGNSAVIKNFIAAIRKNLDEIEKAVSYEV